MGKQVEEKRKQEKNPFKTNFIMFVLIFWNIFLFNDIIRFTKGLEKYPLSTSTAIALVFVIVMAILMFCSKKFRKKVLKEGFELNDVRVLLYLILVVCGSMLIAIVFLFPLLQRLE